MQTVFILREWQLSDKESLAEQANNINIWNNVRDTFPHPYTVADAEAFISANRKKGKPNPDFAIVVDGKAVGGVGIIPQPGVERHTAELGYWLGEDYWGKGIMSEAVKQMVAYAFDNFPLLKLYSHVFDFNTSSKKVLTKAGFELEAVLKKASIKNDRIVDCYYYSKFKEDVSAV
jgi:RimJ/RimL family protein N-acetyltransferase